MKSWVVVLALAVGFAYGLVYLFGLEYSGGGTYPEYSSLRADPAGTKLLFDSLARLPGIEVTRNYLPLDFADARGATMLLLGVAPQAFEEPEQYLHPIEKLARRGNRIVVTFNFPPASRAAALEKEWHVRWAAERRTSYFAEAKDWTVLVENGPRLLAVERVFGSGSVVLFADSVDFANHALLNLGAFDRIAAALGPNRRVVFDEEHFGISESGSVVALARRYRLSGLALGLAICAALFLWKNASAFPPPAPRRAGSLYGRTSQEGLVALLRRHVDPQELAETCWRTYLEAHPRGIRGERLNRVDAILRGGTDQPLEAVRRIGAALHSKGEH